ncbi:MAG TPA: ATP-binding protein [Candidatus Nanoarchaeia archaeon]|nr:ATP-binding protein [Candidatus Nanoarchaeia archaeon]
MTLFKNVEEIEILDMQELVGNVKEIKSLDFKRIIKIDNDSEKEEFLADISSFANSVGGNTIYGIEEENGLATNLCGFKTNNIDSLILKIENLLRDSIKPRINNIGIKSLKLENNDFILLIRIPKSWNSPHMIDFKGKTKFYARNSAGKYKMDVDEIRTSFSLSESITEKIKSFRRERLSIIESGETPIILKNKAKIVLHMIPFNSIGKSENYDLSFLINQETRKPLRTIIAESINHNYNVDGLILYDPNSFSYTQIFRQGMIESVCNMWDTENIIPSCAYEDWLLKTIKNYLDILNGLNIDFPIIIMVSLLDVKGFKMNISKDLEWRLIIPNENKIDRDNLIINGVIMNNKNEDISKLVKPIFDAVWNSCGFANSLNYNGEGVWGKGPNAKDI